MNDQGLLERFVRLETILERSAEDERRQFDRVNDRLGHMQAAVSKMEGRVAELEHRNREMTDQVTRATDSANSAKARANDSVHELSGIRDGLVDHMKALEAVRAAEAAEEKASRAAVERARVAAGDAHRQRFAEQGEAIKTLQSVVQASVKRGERGRWVVAAVIAIVTVVGNQIVEAMKVTHPTPAPAPTSEVR